MAALEVYELGIFNVYDNNEMSGVNSP